MECRHKEVARAPISVAGEHAPGAVGAVRCRREADQQQPRLGVAEAGDRPAPVDLVTIRAPLLARDLLAEAPQTRTEFAGDDGVAGSGQLFFTGGGAPRAPQRGCPVGDPARSPRAFADTSPRIHSPRLGAPPQRGCRAGDPGVAAGAAVTTLDTDSGGPSARRACRRTP